MGYVVHTVGYAYDGIESAQADSTATNRGFTISARDVAGLNFPVPTVRPTTTGKAVAFDIMPKGTPTEVTNNGYAWIDVCSADILNDNNSATYAARVGVQNGYVEFGSRYFNGASATPFKMTVQTGASTWKVVAKGTSNGSFAIGESALATNATTGFLYIPTCAGIPSGVPASETGTAATVYDSTNNKLYIYNGAWKSVALA